MIEIGKTPKPEAYTPDELNALLHKDERLFLSFAAVANRMDKVRQELQRFKVFLFTAITKTGPVTVTPDDIKNFKANFSNFVATPGSVENSFVFDIERPPIAEKAVAPDGVEDNKPIAQ